MTRPLAAWLTTIAANLAAIAFLPPSLFLVQLAVDLLLACGWLARKWWAEKEARKAAEGSRDRIAAEAVRLSDDLTTAHHARRQAELERDIAQDLIAELRKAGARVVRPIRDVTNVIPMQRSDSWLEQVMDEQAGWSE